jgi:hypothetical protein
LAAIFILGFTFDAESDAEKTERGGVNTTGASWGAAMLRPYMRVCGCAMVGWVGCDCKSGGEARALHMGWGAFCVGGQPFAYFGAYVADGYIAWGRIRLSEEGRDANADGWGFGAGVGCNGKSDCGA